jgi:lipopolysaccharide export system protein LptA
MMRRALLGLLIAVAACGAAARAEDKAPFSGLGDDSDKPIKVGAESQQADFEAETITYEGKVRIEQGEMVLRADKVLAEVPDSKIVRVTASGDVVITSRDATARAPLGVYDVAARTIRLTGEVVLTQGGNTLSGTDLLVDLKAGTALLTGKGSASGRVEGVLQPGDAKGQ